MIRSASLTVRCESCSKSRQTVEKGFGGVKGRAAEETDVIEFRIILRRHLQKDRNAQTYKETFAAELLTSEQVIKHN